MRNTPRLSLERVEGTESNREPVLIAFSEFGYSPHLWEWWCGDIGKRHRVSLVCGWWVGKVKVREMYERLKARVRDTETETEIQSHREIGMDREKGPTSRRRQGVTSLASQSLGPILYSDPSPSLPTVPCCQGNREAEYAAKEAGPADLACLHGDWGKGEPHLLT